MTNNEWLEHWISQAPVLSEDSLDDIHHMLISAEDED